MKKDPFSSYQRSFKNVSTIDYDHSWSWCFTNYKGKHLHMKKSRVAFELSTDLYNKLKKLCKENSQGVSEYLRGLIKQEYNNTVAPPPMIGDTAVLEVLKQIEKNTRPKES